MGLSEIPSSLALVLTAFGVRPSFNPITLVGVFCLARSLSFETSGLVHSFPVFLMYLRVIATSFCMVGSCEVYSII